ncbi:MAG: YhgE/Pip domain-containing protein, partial [Bacilli bacterium]
MIKAYHLFLRDLGRIFRNYALLLVVIALLILPSMYAWFNIMASWDPYGRTNMLPVAVCTLDTGEEMNGKMINVGNEIEKELKNNEDLAWVFVSEAEAERGVLAGEYYASIVIPASFSHNLLGILENRFVKPEILYRVNEKKNPISPKITEKGASVLQTNVTVTFQEAISETMLTVFERLGVKLEEHIPDVHRTNEFVSRIEDNLSEIKDMIALLSVETPKLSERIEAVRDEKDRVNEINDQLIALSDSVEQVASNLVGKASEGFESENEVLRKFIQEAKQINGVINELLELSLSPEVEALLLNAKSKSDSLIDITTS